jgi:hypothetical protein
MVALQDSDEPLTHKTFSVYVVVLVGCTTISLLLRFGYTRLSHGMLGENVAKFALKYDAFKFPVCPG